MDSATFAVEARVEKTHWWFVGRRRLIEIVIKKQKIPPTSLTMDIGSGTGNNLRLFKELGFQNVVGIDISQHAIIYCKEKGLGEVRKADATMLPFRNDQFNLILATDILEHIDDDGKAISEIHRVLSPGGLAIITAPAFQFLWGHQDRVSHHKRRYRKRDLMLKFKRADFQITEAFYFNSILFIPIWVSRMAIQLLRIRIDSENQINTPMLNTFLTYLFVLDIKLATNFRLPFGVSIFALLKK